MADEPSATTTSFTAQVIFLRLPSLMRKQRAKKDSFI